MEYMEAKMQEVYDAADQRLNAIESEFEEFRDWFLSIPDVDETLVDRSNLNNKRHLVSGCDVADAMWLGWRKAKGL